MMNTPVAPPFASHPPDTMGVESERCGALVNLIIKKV